MKCDSLNRYIGNANINRVSRCIPDEELSMVKIFNIKDIPRTKVTDGREMINIVDEKAGARNVGITKFIIKPGEAGSSYHWHRKRETILIITSGSAKQLIDGKEYTVEPNTVVFLPPGTRTRIIENIGSTNFEMLEVFSPIDPNDRVDVLERE